VCVCVCMCVCWGRGSECVLGNVRESERVCVCGGERVCM